MSVKCSREHVVKDRTLSGGCSLYRGANCDWTIQYICHCNFVRAWVLGRDFKFSKSHWNSTTVGLGNLGTWNWIALIATLALSKAENIFWDWERRLNTSSPTLSSSHVNLGSLFQIDLRDLALKSWQSIGRCSLRARADSETSALSLHFSIEKILEDPCIETYKYFWRFKKSWNWRSSFDEVL